MHGLPGTRLLLAALLTLTVLTGSAPGQTPARRSRPKAAAETMVQRMYPVTDLVVPIPEYSDDGKQKAAKELLHQELMERIKKSVAPESWEELGGQGTMQFFPLGMSLVIRQSPTAHQKIKRLLIALRRKQGLSITCELRFVSISEATYKSLASSKVGGTVYPKRLTEQDYKRYLKRISADETTQIMQMPRVTAFNDQRVPVNSVQKLTFQTGIDVVQEADRVSLRLKSEDVETGVKWSVHPVVTSDCRAVDLTSCFHLASIDALVPQIPVVLRLEDKGPRANAPRVGSVQRPKVTVIKHDATVRLADGETAVLDAGAVESETRRESGPPIVSQIPYINRFVRTVGYGRERRHFLLLVTTRIIEAEEEDLILLADEPRSRDDAEESEATPEPRR